jgi:hypothetical protein
MQILRAKINFARRFKRIERSGFFPENFTSVFQKYVLISAHPALSGGALRPIVTNVGSGMRWTHRRRKTSAAGADGEIVWS